jgi:xanthine dehydrogenase iron-sulfur cluster and FAD-binding subunit A
MYVEDLYIGQVATLEEHDNQKFIIPLKRAIVLKKGNKYYDLQAKEIYGLYNKEVEENSKFIDNVNFKLENISELFSEYKGKNISKRKILKKIDSLDQII